MEINNTLKTLYNTDKKLEKEETKKQLESKEGELFLALDLNKDNKVDVLDMLTYSKNKDIDGDGKVTKEEQDFLEQIFSSITKTVDESMDTLSAKENYDINNDGKINRKDYEEFMKKYEEAGWLDTAPENDSSKKVINEFLANLKVATQQTYYDQNDLFKELYKNDPTLTNKDILNELKEGGKYYLALDRTGDNKVDVKDIFSVKTHADINGDGKIDEQENKFTYKLLNTLMTDLNKKMDKGTDQSIYDINNDGAIDQKDYQNFQNLFNENYQWIKENGGKNKRQQVFQKFLSNLTTATNNYDGLAEEYKNAPVKDSFKLDINGDEKVDLKDLVNFNTNVDLNKDGKVSEDETKFLESEQTRLINILKKQKNYDVNGDNKIDINDLSEFLEMTTLKGNLNTQNDQVAKFLKEIQSHLNKMVLGIGEDWSGLAELEYKRDIANKIANGKFDASTLTNDFKKQFDINNDGKIDKKDANLLNSAISSLNETTGLNSNEIKQNKTNINKLEKEIDTLNKNIKSANTKISTAKQNLEKAKADLKKVNNEYNTAITEENKAKANLQAVQNALTEAEESLSYFEKNSDFYKQAQTLITKLKTNVAAAQTKVDQATANKIIKKEEVDKQTKIVNENTNIYNKELSNKNSMTEKLTTKQKELAKAQKTKFSAYDERKSELETEQKKSQNIQYNIDILKANEELQTAKNNRTTAENNYNKTKATVTKNIENYTKQLAEKQKALINKLSNQSNTDEINKIQQEIAALNDKIKAEKQKLADAEKTLNKAKTAIAKIETNITAINKKYGKQ